MTSETSERKDPFNPKHEITIVIEESMISRVGDETLAFWWHLAQHNPANGFENKEPGDLAMKVGWEIIRRWLAKAPVEMYHHQQGHYTRNIARSLGSWPGPGHRKFVPNEPVTADLSVVLEALDEAINRVHLLDPGKETAYKKARTAIREGMQAEQRPEGEGDRG